MLSMDNPDGNGLLCNFNNSFLTRFDSAARPFCTLFLNSAPVCALFHILLQIRKAHTSRTLSPTNLLIRSESQPSSTLIRTEATWIQKNSTKIIATIIATVALPTTDLGNCCYFSQPCCYFTSRLTIVLCWNVTA